jgi:DNA-binding transcriptional ArsR family regulator
VEATATKAGSATRKLDFVNPQLAAAMSHPTRVHALSILAERVASPREIARELNEPLNNVTYHVNQLRDLGCVELVKTERAHGGRVLEHFYRSSRRMYFDNDAWDVLSAKEKLGVVGAIVKMISQDIAAAMAAGTFFGDGNGHISRSPMRVDQEGWREVGDLLTRTTAELVDIEARIAGRTADDESGLIDSRVEILQFRSPPGAPPTPRDT